MRYSVIHSIYIFSFIHSFVRGLFLLSCNSIKFIYFFHSPNLYTFHSSTSVYFIYLLNLYAFFHSFIHTWFFFTQPLSLYCRFPFQSNLSPFFVNFFLTFGIFFHSFTHFYFLFSSVQMFFIIKFICRFSFIHTLNLYAFFHLFFHLLYLYMPLLFIHSFIKFMWIFSLPFIHVFFSIHLLHL